MSDVGAAVMAIGWCLFLGGCLFIASRMGRHVEHEELDRLLEEIETRDEEEDLNARSNVSSAHDAR